MTILFVFISLLVPWGVLKITPHFRLTRLLGPFVSCYVLGMLLGNISLTLPVSLFESLTQISILFGLVILLFMSNVRAWHQIERKTLLSFFLIILSVFLTCFLGYFLFKEELFDAHKVVAMALGVYVGGTSNMSAISYALKVDKDVFLLMNVIDTLFSGVYFLFLLVGGASFYHLFLPQTKKAGENEKKQETSQSHQSVSHFKDYGFVFFLAVLGVLLAIGLSHLFFGKEEGVFIILILTSYSLVISSRQKIIHLDSCHKMGNYFLYLFCFGMGALTNFSLLIQMSYTYIYLVGFVFISSILLHLLLCHFFKIDRDTAVITSIASLYGPVFAAPVSQVLDNKELLLVGVTLGLIGHAIGNYLAFILVYLLS